jgi:hypothetical protein
LCWMRVFNRSAYMTRKLSVSLCVFRAPLHVSRTLSSWWLSKCDSGVQNGPDKTLRTLCRMLVSRDP